MRLHRLFCAAIPLLLISASGLFAQTRNNHVDWELLTKEISGRPGDTVEVQLQFITAPEAMMYGFRSYEDRIFGPVPTTVAAGGTLALSEKNPVTTDVSPTLSKDPSFADTETEAWGGKVIMTISVRIAEDAPEGEREGWVNVNYMTRTEKSIRPPSDVRFPIIVQVRK